MLLFVFYIVFLKLLEALSVSTATVFEKQQPLSQSQLMSSAACENKRSKLTFFRKNIDQQSQFFILTWIRTLQHFLLWCKKIFHKSYLPKNCVLNPHACAHVVTQIGAKYVSINKEGTIIVSKRLIFDKKSTDLLHLKKWQKFKINNVNLTCIAEIDEKFGSQTQKQKGKILTLDPSANASSISERLLYVAVTLNWPDIIKTMSFCKLLCLQIVFFII